MENEILNKMLSAINRLEKGQKELRESIETIAIQTETTMADVQTLKENIDNIKTRTIRMENENSQKLGAIFDKLEVLDGKTDRIEKQVTRHEEIIFRIK